MQTPLSQTLAYAVSQLRADFVAFSSRKLEALASPRDFSTLFSISGVIRGVPPPIFRRQLHADSGHTTRSIHIWKKPGS